MVLVDGLDSQHLPGAFLASGQDTPEGVVWPVSGQLLISAPPYSLDPAAPGTLWRGVQGGHRGAGTWGIQHQPRLDVRLGWPWKRELPHLLNNSAAEEQSPYILEASVGFQESPCGPGMLGEPLHVLSARRRLRGSVCAGREFPQLRRHPVGAVVQSLAATKCQPVYRL